MLPDFFSTLSPRHSSFFSYQTLRLQGALNTDGVPESHDNCVCVLLYCNFVYFSACSGLTSAVLGTPADVVKTRVMNQQYINGR